MYLLLFACFQVSMYCTCGSLLAPGSVGDALVKHFFGEEEEKRLTVEEFQKFHRQLTMEILKLEVHVTFQLKHTYTCTSC